MSKTEELQFKERLFAQYWGQEVGCDKYSDSYEVNSSTLSGSSLLSVTHLLLADLSKITDEHLIEVAKIIGRNNSPIGCENNPLMAAKAVCYWFNENKGDYENFISASRWEHLISFLRSKGYALPFQGITVEQQIERGMIKLRKCEHKNIDREDGLDECLDCGVRNY